MGSCRFRRRVSLDVAVLFFRFLPFDSVGGGGGAGDGDEVALRSLSGRGGLLFLGGDGGLGGNGGLGGDGLLLGGEDCLGA